VAVAPDRAAENVRSFPTFTQDLYALADWLKQYGVKTAATESTGVYWIPLFQLLEGYGFEVCLVNARHVKNVPGRRTDCVGLLMAAVSAFGRTVARLLGKVSCKWQPPTFITCRRRWTR
jgi:transposase